MIRQCAILFGCLALGELIVFLTGIKLPSSIIGMLLLTLFLKLGWIKLQWVQGLSDFLVANLGFFFVPPGVALMLYFDVIDIAISDGAEIAREIADITVGADDLNQILMLKKLSDSLIKKINRNYRVIVGFNSALIALGVTGVIQPTTSALLHNTSTLVISLESMKNLPV